MVMRGCLRGAIGTAPMRKRPVEGSSGVKQEVMVHAPSQPAITAQALKAMPTGPKRSQNVIAIPAIQRRRIRPIIRPLSNKGYRRPIQAPSPPIPTFPRAGGKES